MDDQLGLRIRMRGELLRLFDAGKEYEADGRLDGLLIDLKFRGLAAVPLLTGDEGAPLYEQAKAAAIGAGFPVIEYTDEDAPYTVDDQTLGMFLPDSGHIYVRVTDSKTNMAKVIIHEIAHALSEEALSDYEHLTFSSLNHLRRAAEVHAESVAFVVLALRSIDAIESSAPYVASHGVRDVDQDAMSAAIVTVALGVERLLSPAA